MTLHSAQNSTDGSTKRLWHGGVSVDVASRLDQITGTVLRIAQMVLLVVTVGLIACLAPLANHQEETWPRWVPRWARWLNQGSDWHPVVLVTAVIALLCILTYRSRRNRSSAAVPVMIVVGLTATSVVLGFSSYWRCTNDAHPTFIAPLLWTASLVKGGIGDVSLQSSERLANAKLCPSDPVPTALEVARLTIVAAIFIGLAVAAAAAFRVQSDRLRAALARSVTVVADLDDDSAPMIAGIARTLNSNSSLVLMTDNPDNACIAESRRQGARIVQVDFDRAGTVVAHRFWRRLNRLYLLSADPSTNLLRLSVISQRLAPIATKRRIPLIVRIDDPWLAEAWRAQQFGQHGGGSDHLWAADTVSTYEATARRLIDQVLDHSAIRRLIVCGTSQLTLALCDEMALRHTERRFHNPQGAPELPAVTLVASDADEFTRDHEARHKRKGFTGSPPPVDAITKVPSAPVVSNLVEQTEGGDATKAVIVVDSAAAADPILGTRLAASHPTVPIYMWDPAARLNAERIPVACELRTYRLGMELPDGHAHDNFERTAMLIHERYASSQADRTKPASMPWEKLSDFYKGSNRRQLTNALWMVEKIAGHTWKSGVTPDDHVSLESLEELDAVPEGETTSPDDPSEVAVKKLQRLGFSEDTIYRMAQAEWKHWSRYLRDRGWTWGAERNTKKKQHERLVDSWEATLADPTLKAIALKSFVDAQIALEKLARLGFSEDQAYAMAKAEWESWSRYLRKHGWTQGDERDERKKKHEKLVDNWEATVADPELKAAALKSLAGTLIELMKLGYRSRPMWTTYERVGAVTAKRRRMRWNWTTASGETVHASAGTWEVRDGGHSWPVRNDIFHASYRNKRGNNWERRGMVLARRARPGETIHTLEGPETAVDGDWVIQGNRGEQWLVPRDEFCRRYRGPVDVYEFPKVPTTDPEPARV
jgi:hypothetical protein